MLVKNLTLHGLIDTALRQEGTSYTLKPIMCVRVCVLFSVIQNRVLFGNTLIYLSAFKYCTYYILYVCVCLSGRVDRSR